MPILKGDVGEPGMTGLPGVEGIQVGDQYFPQFYWAGKSGLVCYFFGMNVTYKVRIQDPVL